MSNEKRNWSSLSTGNIWNPKVDKEGKALQPSANSVIEGVYLSRKDDTGEQGNSTLYKMMAHSVGNKQLEKPEPLSFWGSHVLDDLMEGVTPGSYIQVKWLGLKTPKKGGKDFHNWDVAIDKSYVPEGGSAPVNSNAAPVAQEEDDTLPF